MLADLDELILTCADPRSKAYIKESVLCYKAGAYRSSVVACWIAVAFDLVDKIRELAATGDKLATEQVNRFEQIQLRHDLVGALAFEKELPDMALNKFEFISPLEYQDLVRLVEDRNRCAHPSQVSDSQVFQASAELARLHISNSVRSILSQPAAQGKVALDRIMTDMDSNYFPDKPKEVYDFLQAGPLGKPKKSLYQNMLTVLIKTVTQSASTHKRRSRSRNALVAMKNMHPELWQSHFPQTLNKITEAVINETDLVSTAYFLIKPPELAAWQDLSTNEKLRIKTFILNIPTQFLNSIDSYLSLKSDHELYKAANSRIMLIGFAELKEVSWDLFIPSEAFARTVQFYARSASFAEANEIGKFLRTQLPILLDAPSHLDELIRIGKTNSQVLQSNEYVHVLRALASDNNVGIELIKSKVHENRFIVDGL